MEDTLLELAGDEGLKRSSEKTPSLGYFGIQGKVEYELAPKTLLPCASTYICKNGSSTMSGIKTN